MNPHILDTRFQGMPQVTAVYLLSGPGGPVLVESGPGSTLPAILDALAAHDLRPADIRHVLLTHIHLDHAGAAGWWAQQGAQLYVHHVGAPHLVDPSKLIASATRIYGDRMEPLWGDILPAPAERVTALYDGDTVEAAGLVFTALDTPGHAYHHHAYRISDGHGGAILFTGDAAGVSLPHVGVVDLPAPPPEFHLETWLATLERLEATVERSSENVHTFYPTHFGPIRDIHGHLTQLRTLMIDAVAFVSERVKDLAGGDLADLPKPVRARLLEDYIGWNRERAAALRLSPTIIESYALANPLFMSVDGILRYLRKRGL